MQNVGSYLLEFRSDNLDELEIRWSAITARIGDWLRSKKVENPDLDLGNFISLTGGSQGSYKRVRLVTEDGKVEEITLVEPTEGGQIFQTIITLGRKGSLLVVHSNLVIRNSQPIVAPVKLNPRCPHIIRSILGEFDDWTIRNFDLGASKVTDIDTEEKAFALVDLIKEPIRTIPIITISQIEGESLWPKLSEKISYDLAGLARVFEIDEDSSWILTDEVGKINSCYLGAVRLYWPIREQSKIFPGSIWTASNLLSDDYDGKGLERFRLRLRRLIMGVSAISLELPRVIRDLRISAARDRLKQLEERASGFTEELELARMYADENQELREENELLLSEVTSLLGRAESAEFVLNNLKGAGISIGQESSQFDDNDRPEPGEVRFYKKTHSKGNYDVLVRVKDCGHNAWQSSNKADMAKKGIERHEGVGNWRSVMHCGRCTGGGLWKVVW